MSCRNRGLKTSGGDMNKHIKVEERAKANTLVRHIDSSILGRSLLYFSLLYFFLFPPLLSSRLLSTCLLFLFLFPLLTSPVFSYVFRWHDVTKLA